MTGGKNVLSKQNRHSTWNLAKLCIFQSLHLLEAETVFSKEVLHFSWNKPKLCIFQCFHLTGWKNVLSKQSRHSTWSLCFVICVCIGNSTVSRGIWDKYREWYFKIRQNITSRHGEWYLESFEISRAGIYTKYPEETVLFFVYTTRQRNFASCNGV